MQRPEIIGWEVTENEQGVKMATLPLSLMHNIVEYHESIEKKIQTIKDESNDYAFNCSKYHDLTILKTHAINQLRAALEDKSCVIIKLQKEVVKYTSLNLDYVNQINQLKDEIDKKDKRNDEFLSKYNLAISECYKENLLLKDEIERLKKSINLLQNLIT